ncbi:MAG: prepilin-type N-terminal cleavage/methylation domain-containing protein [Motiliproteus sp.]|nr:prepilin-type N-terminal cleavage/methylation domain-containing protein [Motiliproteus sp.]MCW9050887.1 prepilin-type N-terminal cleavage/methylation domain-containing protein [Motiliproteus sp.]
MKRSEEAGFSLVELIAVILILSITAVVVLPRFSGDQSYRNLILKDDLILMARFAQQSSLIRHNQAVTLEMSLVGGNWLFSVQADTDNDGTNDLEVKRLLLEQGSSSLTMSAPSTIGVNSSTPLIIGYDNLGNITEVNGSAISSNIHFDASGRSVCVSLAGYAYESANQSSCVSD